MTERHDTKNIILEDLELEQFEIKDSKFSTIDRVFQDFAPEIAYLYQIREDESEEQQIKTGRLHENRILGIFLKYNLEGRKNITTGDVEDEYRLYFRDIARSTTSTYLNMLKKEASLYTEREGRTVYYFLHENPPIRIKPFWFTRIFCIVPVYFSLGTIFSKFYLNSDQYIQDYINQNGEKDREVLNRNFRFIIGLIMLNIFKNRSSKCMICQFSKKVIYEKLKDLIKTAIKDRSDVLPEELINNIIAKYSEFPNFLEERKIDVTEITSQISRYADIYKKDLEFQIMVSNRRKDIRIKQKLTLEEEK